MSRLGLRLREPDRGRRRFLNREWWWSPTVPAFWRLACADDCRAGEPIQRGCERHYYDPHNLCEVCMAVEGVALDTYSHRPDCPCRPRYLGTLAKGWWYLGTLRQEMWRSETRLVFAVGGEDNMLQLTVQLPFLGLVAAGVRVPRALTRPWVYERRELGFRLDHWVWPTLLIGYDDEARVMRDYYYALPQLPDYVTRVGLWAGWKLEVPYWRWLRLQNRVLGKVELSERDVKRYDGVLLALPEGVYAGSVRFYRSRAARRWHTIRDGMVGEFKTDDEAWLPFPGKGESSYDCGDDGLQEHSTTIGPGRMSEHEIDHEDVARVVADTIAYVLRRRSRYGRYDWQPEAKGVMRP